MRMIECEPFATMLASKAGFASVRTVVTRRAAEHGLEELVREVDADPVEANAVASRRVDDEFNVHRTPWPAPFGQTQRAASRGGRSNGCTGRSKPIGADRRR